MDQRHKATDRYGIPLAPGIRVRILDDDVQFEGTIVRVIGDYDRVTVLVEQRSGKAERMYPCADLEVLTGVRQAQTSSAA